MPRPRARAHVRPGWLCAGSGGARPGAPPWGGCVSARAGAGGGAAGRAEARPPRAPGAPLGSAPRRGPAVDSDLCLLRASAGQLGRALGWRGVHKQTPRAGLEPGAVTPKVPRRDGDSPGGPCPAPAPALLPQGGRCLRITGPAAHTGVSAEARLKLGPWSARVQRRPLGGGRGGHRRPAPHSPDAESGTRHESREVGVLVSRGARRRHWGAGEARGAGATAGWGWALDILLLPKEQRPSPPARAQRRAATPPLAGGPERVVVPGVGRGPGLPGKGRPGVSARCARPNRALCPPRSRPSCSWKAWRTRTRTCTRTWRRTRPT